MPNHMNCILKLLLTLTLFATIGLKINAQKSSAGFQHLTTKNGLSDNLVLTFLQDHEGFMWMGTHDGLNKFDGYNFTVYKKTENGTNNLTDNIIRCLTEDSLGNIWAGTNNGGLIKFNRRTEKFSNYIYNPSNPDAKMMVSSINNIIIGSNNNIWFALGRESLVRFNPETETFKSYTNVPKNNKTLGDNFIATLFRNSKNELMIGTSSCLSFYNSSEDNFENVYFQKQDTEFIRINAVYEEIKGAEEIYWLSSSVGLIRYNRTKKSYSIFELFEKGVYEFEANNMITINKGNDGNFWIGTPNGLAIFNTATNNFYPSSKVIEVNETLIGNSIITSYIDRAGIIWFSFDRNGIAKYDSKIRKFNLYKNNPFDEQSIPNKVIHSIFQNKDTSIWLGTIQKGLVLLDKNKKKIANYNHIKGDPNSLASDNINVVYEDTRGNLWIGYAIYGLDRALQVNKNRANINKFIHYPFNPQNPVTIPHETVVSVFEDSKGRLWIGTEGGLVRFDYESEQFFQYFHNPQDKNSITHNSVQAAIAEDKNGFLWIGTWNGLTKMDASDLNNIKFYQYKNNSKNSNSLAENRVISICIDDLGNIWLGSFGGGLIKLSAEEAKKKNPEDAKFISYTESNGLSNNTIYVVLNDGFENLWMSTNNGLSKFDINTETFSNYYESSGLQSNAFYWGSGFYGLNGELFFGGPRGFNSFFSDKISHNTYSPPVVITDLRIANEPVTISENSVLEKTISETEELILNHNHKIFSFEFAALHYSVPENNKYKYKLEGFDNKWHNVKANKRFATYTNLDAGKYTFRVKATNSEGFWSDKEASIKIIIKPPYWETIWFKALIVSALMALIIAFYYFRLNSIKKRNTLLAKLVKERTGELNEKNKLLTQHTENLSEINILLKNKQKMVSEQAEELKLQRDELYDSNAIKDKLFSIISHDLLGPVSALKGIFELLEGRFDKITNEKKIELINASVESLTSLHALLVNLLDWSRFQRGTITFTPISTDLNKIIETNIKLAKSQLQNKNIEVKRTFEFNEFFIYLDNTLINTVIRNLLNNAIKFSDKNSFIEISYKTTPKEVTVAIKDYGIGMTNEVLEKIFNDNVNYTTKGTHKEVGTGLGLNICKEFIKIHKGKIWVESEINLGSTFFFSVPLKKGFPK